MVNDIHGSLQALSGAVVIERVMIEWQGEGNTSEFIEEVST